MRRYAFAKVTLMLSHGRFSGRTMIGSCSAIPDLITSGFPALLSVAGFTSGELSLFIRGFLETVVFVAVVDRVDAFALIVLMAGGGLGDGAGGVFVLVEPRVAGADGFAPVMVTSWSRSELELGTRWRRVVPRDLLILSCSTTLTMLPTPDLSHLSKDDKLHVYDPAGKLRL